MVLFRLVPNGHLRRYVLPMQEELRQQDDGMEHAGAGMSTLVGEFAEEGGHPPKGPPIPPHFHTGMDQWFFRYSY